MKQAFVIKEKNDFFFSSGHYVLSKDSSLMISTGLVGNFELLLGDGYHVSLGIDRDTGECLTFYTLLDAIAFAPFSFGSYNARQASLFFKSSSLKTQEGDHYAPFVEKMYYDEKALILAFGDVDVQGDFVEFSKDTFAMVLGEELVAVYIKAPQNAIDRIKMNEVNRKKRFGFFRK